MYYYVASTFLFGALLTLFFAENKKRKKKKRKQQQQVGGAKVFIAPGTEEKVSEGGEVKEDDVPSINLPDLCRPIPSCRPTYSRYANTYK